jgi:signal peptidase I
LSYQIDYKQVIVLSDELNYNGSSSADDLDEIDLASDVNPDMYFNDESKSEKKTMLDKFNLHKMEETADDEEDDESGGKFETAPADGFAAGLYDWIRCIIFAVAIVVVCLVFIFRLVDVEGTSMNDTLSTNDKVIVTNMLYVPHNNDIVVISHGAEYKKPIIKRVIATEGQSVKLDYENDKIIVDGIELDEPYIKGTTFSGNVGDNVIPDVIPEGKIFVMGDNRRVSLDSRSTQIGLIDRKDVIGKAQFVAFPFNHFGYLY